MPTRKSFTQDDLINFVPRFDSFVGIDSDGCVFDTMEVKQKEHFHPLIVKLFQLEPVERNVRAAAEFVNLHSKWRGRNRFPDLLKVFELLREWPEVLDSGVALPDTRALETYVHSGLPLGNPSLKQEVERTHDPQLERVYRWSLAVSASIDTRMQRIPPFPWARKSLHRIAAHSDAIVVSQTPEAALVKEWTENEIDAFISVIAGQELGRKSEHIALATKGRYAPDRILMMGDAPGDRNAAADNGAHFYAINPGHEEASWERFHDEAYDRFLAGTYGGPYEERVIAEFEALLPDTPPWQRR